jgi:hypothetical protein
MLLRLSFRGAAKPSPEFKNTGLWNMDSGLRPSDGPGMTANWDLE